MSIFNTEHKRKSASITTALMIVLLLLMFVFGLKSLNPPPESGIAVNFGTTETGSGNVETKKTPKANTAPVQEEQEVEPQETEATVAEEQPETTTEAATEEVVTQESEESIAIKKAEEAKRKAEEAEKAAKAEADRVAKEKREAEEKLKAEQAKKMAEIDALTKGVTDSKGEDENGEGTDKNGGNKGDPKGDPYASSYYGQPGSGTGGEGGTGLIGRTRLFKPEVSSDCKSDGKVVISIKVNNQGKVIEAKRGPGTTAIEQCLIDTAIAAAYKFKWNADAKAPAAQIGVIEFKFTLGQ